VPQADIAALIPMGQLAKTICGRPTFCEIEMGPEFLGAICPACADGVLSIADLQK
jgi:hypothetical protein